MTSQCSTRWTSSARRASPSRPARCAWSTRPRRPDLRAQPDRHAWATSTSPTRSAAACGLRGRHPRGRRRPGHRGPDARQRLPGARAGPDHHPGHQQDRPAVAQPDVVIEEIESVLGIPHEEILLASAKEGTGIGDPRGHRRARPPPKGDPDAPAPGPDLRLALRRLQRRHRLRARGRRHARSARDDPPDGHGPRRISSSSASSGRSWCPMEQLGRRRGRLRRHRPEDVDDCQVGDT